MVLTAFWWQLLKINLQTDIVVVLWLWPDQGAILPLQDVVHAVPDEFVPAADVHGQHERSLAIGGRQAEADAIEIDKLDIERGGSEEIQIMYLNIHCLNIYCAYFVCFARSFIVCWMITFCGSSKIMARCGQCRIAPRRHLLARSAPYSPTHSNLRHAHCKENDRQHRPSTMRMSPLCRGPCSC